MPQGIKVGPAAWANYAQRRLEKYQLLYEPGHELECEEPYNQPITAELPQSRLVKNGREPHQALTEEMLRPRPPPKHGVIIFVDDMLCITASYATHIRLLKRILIACGAESMFINSKAVFACKTVQFVGFGVSYDGVACMPDKIEAIYQLPDSYYNKTDLRIFLGKCMFFHSFIPAKTDAQRIPIRVIILQAHHGYSLKAGN